MTRIARGAAMLLCLAAVTACGVGEARSYSEPTAAPDSPLPVASTSAYITDLYATYQASSILAADGEASVPARVAGEVVEILVEEGDRVVQGQLLARQDSQRLRLQVLHSDAEYLLRRSEYRRQKPLADRGLLGQAAVDSLRYEVDALGAALELDRLDYSYTEIRAPITGVVSRRELRLGQYLQSGDLAFRISDTSRLVTTLRVPQTELSRIAAGMPVELQVAAADVARVPSAVARISPVVDRHDGSVRVTVYVDNDKGLLAPGMYARINIHYEKFANAIVVPPGAVVNEDGTHVVYVINDGIAERREVIPGARANDELQILHGIRAGELVVSDANSGIRDGAAIKAVPTAATRGT